MELVVIHTGANGRYNLRPLDGVVCLMSGRGTRDLTIQIQLQMADHSNGREVTAFAGHAFAGTAIFVILALLAFLLGKFIHLLASWGADEFLVTILTGLEYLLLCGDAVFLVAFVYTAVKVALKEARK